jgi:hypothetical protein
MLIFKYKGAGKKRYETFWTRAGLLFLGLGERSAHGLIVYFFLVYRPWADINVHGFFCF